MRTDAGWVGVGFTGGQVTGKGGAEETEHKSQRPSNSSSTVMRKTHRLKRVPIILLMAGQGKGREGVHVLQGQAPPHH